MMPVVTDRLATMNQYSLTDAVSCEVTKSESGEYALKLLYPVGGIHSDMLILYNRIECITSRADTYTQPFIITKIEQSINGMFTVTAQHQTYMLSWYPVRAFAKASRTPQEAVDALFANAVRNPSTDSLLITAEESTKKEEFGFTRPTTMREAVYGSGGLLDVYGGYVLADKNKLSWVSELTGSGMPRRIIQYGVNLQKFRRSFDISDMYSHIYAYWGSGDELVQTPGLAPIRVDADFTSATTIDLTGEFDAAPTVEQLTEKARSIAAQRDLFNPEVSLDIAFVPLQLTDEYKHTTWLEEVDLFDKIQVEVPMYGTPTSARVTKTQFDVLNENYKKITVGNLSRSLDRTIARLI